MEKSLNNEDKKPRDSFQFANTLQFLHLFHEILDIDHLSPMNLEELLQEPIVDEKNCRIALVYKRLVKALHKSKAHSDDFLSKSICREYRIHEVEEPVYLQAVMDGFTKIWPLLGALTPMQHLQTLHDLCTFQLYDTEKFSLLSNFVDLGEHWRITPVGQDKNKANYWFIADLWLYLEHACKDNDKEEEDDGDWECICWDAASWKEFLEKTSLRTSRRVLDKQLLQKLEKDIYPIVEPIIIEEEQRLAAEKKKHERELQRMLFIQSRQHPARSSQVLARERLHRQLVAPAPTSSPLSPSAIGSRKRMSIPPSRSTAMMAMQAQKPPSQSREERLAMREKRNTRREAEALVQELLENEKMHQEEGSAHLEMSYSEEIDPTVESDNVESLESASEEEMPRSPIKLLLKIGPDGPMRSDLFIGDQLIEKVGTEQSSSTTKIIMTTRPKEEQEKKDILNAENGTKDTESQQTPSETFLNTRVNFDTITDKVSSLQENTASEMVMPTILNHFTNKDIINTSTSFKTKQDLSSPITLTTLNNNDLAKTIPPVLSNNDEIIKEENKDDLATTTITTPSLSTNEHPAQVLVNTATEKELAVATLLTDIADLIQ